MLARSFSVKYTKLKEEKCHFMIFGNKSEDSVVGIGKCTIKESYYSAICKLLQSKIICSSLRWRYSRNNINPTFMKDIFAEKKLL